MVFVSHEVLFSAKSDRRSRVAGNGTECEVKTIELSLQTSGDEQLPCSNVAFPSAGGRWIWFFTTSGDIWNIIPSGDESAQRATRGKKPYPSAC